MSRPQSKATAKANIRKAWIASRLSEGMSDAQLVALGAVIHKVAESTIRKDLSDVYNRWMEIYEENEPQRLAKFMELGLAILAECRDAGQKTLNFSSAVSQFKNLAIMAGVMREGLLGKTEANAGGDYSRPTNQDVLERLAELKKNPEIRDRAMRLGLDLDKKSGKSS
jgi:hypothetical protein